MAFTMLAGGATSMNMDIHGLEWQFPWLHRCRTAVTPSAMFFAAVASCQAVLWHHRLSKLALT